MRSSRSWPRATTILGATFGKPRAKTSCARSMRPDRRSPRSSQQVMLFQRRHTRDVVASGLTAHHRLQRVVIGTSGSEGDGRQCLKDANVLLDNPSVFL